MISPLISHSGMHQESVRNAMAVRRWPALRKHVDDDDKTTLPIRVSGSNYKTRAILINESGLCSLVLPRNCHIQKYRQKTSGKWAGFCPNYLVVLKIFRIFVG